MLLFHDLMEYDPLGFLVHGISQARILEWVAISELTSPAWQADFFTAEPPEKPGVASV